MPSSTQTGASFLARLGQSSRMDARSGYNGHEKLDARGGKPEKNGIQCCKVGCTGGREIDERVKVEAGKQGPLRLRLETVRLADWLAAPREGAAAQSRDEPKGALRTSTPGCSAEHVARAAPAEAPHTRSQLTSSRCRLLLVAAVQDEACLAPGQPAARAKAVEDGVGRREAAAHGHRGRHAQ